MSPCYFINLPSLSSDALFPLEEISPLDEPTVVEIAALRDASHRRVRTASRNLLRDASSSPKASRFTSESTLNEIRHQLLADMDAERDVKHGSERRVSFSDEA